MIIDFENTEYQDFPNFKGGEKTLEAKMWFDGKCRIMKGRLQPGASIGMHTHETSCEVYFIKKGNPTVIFDGEEYPLHEGSVHYCPKGHTHSLVNRSDEIAEFDAVIPEQ